MCSSATVRGGVDADPSDVVGLVFVDATHEALDSRALAFLPMMYSLMLVLCRVNFVRRGFGRQLSPQVHRLRPERASSIGEDRSGWPIGFRTARAEGAGVSPALAQLRRDCPNLPP